MRRRASHEQQSILAAFDATYCRDEPGAACRRQSRPARLYRFGKPLVTLGQFDRATNDLIPALRVANRERASNEAVSVILSNLGYSYRMPGRCGDAVTVLTEEMRGWDRGMTLDQARFAGINLLQSYLGCGESRSAARSWSKTLIPIA